MQLDRARRKAAGKVILATFFMLNNIANHMLVFNHLEWGEDLFTPKEKAYLERMRERIHQDGEAMRGFGRRLCA